MKATTFRPGPGEGGVGEQEEPLQYGIRPVRGRVGRTVGRPAAAGPRVRDYFVLLSYKKIALQMFLKCS